MNCHLKNILFGLFCAVLWGCDERPVIERSAQECSPIPNGGRACAACFVLDEQAYFFGGRDTAGVYHNDLWRYTPATDTWEDLGTTPLGARVNATACAHDGKVYIGLGFYGRYSSDSSYLRDWWEYTPATMNWTKLTDYPNYNTDCATCFVGDGELYVGYGFSWSYKRDMFRYNIAENQWDSIDVGVSFHGYPTRSFGGTGCTCQGRHFMGTGYYRNSLDWWAELLPEGQWIERKAVPGRGRTVAACAASKDYIYLCGGLHFGGATGRGEVLQDFYRYDPQHDDWRVMSPMPQRLMNHVCFAIGTQVFFGLGENEDYIINDKLYRIAE